MKPTILAFWDMTRRGWISGADVSKQRIPLIFKGQLAMQTGSLYGSLNPTDEGNPFLRSVAELTTRRHIPDDGEPRLMNFSVQWRKMMIQIGFSYLLNPVVTKCTTRLTCSNSKFCTHSVFVCFVWIWEQKAIISLYNINWLVFITEIYPSKAQWSLYVPPV